MRRRRKALRAERRQKSRYILLFTTKSKGYNNDTQERLKAAEAKRIEKERTEKYQKLKGDAKDTRSKYREKVERFLETFTFHLMFSTSLMPLLNLQMKMKSHLTKKMMDLELRRKRLRKTQ